MLTFEKHSIPDLKFKKAVKKPIPIRCVQISEPFIVETIEGEMRGKKGDWLMVGVSGELYVCDNDIFNKSYQLLEK